MCLAPGVLSSEIIFISTITLAMVSQWLGKTLLSSLACRSETKSVDLKNLDVVTLWKNTLCFDILCVENQAWFVCSANCGRFVCCTSSVAAAKVCF